MELVTKKKLHLVSGGPTGRWPRRSPITCASAGRGQHRGFLQRRDPLPVRRVRAGMDVFIIQSHGASGACRSTTPSGSTWRWWARPGASAKRITAVMPFYGYGRQDRQGRAPRAHHRQAGGQHVHRGAGRLLSVDLHSGQIQGFIDNPFDHLTAMPVLVDYLREHMGDDLVVVSPDAGPGQGGRALRQRPPRRPGHRAQAPGQGAGGRGQGGGRQRRGPHLRAGRRHDRHRRHVGGRRRAAGRAGRQPGVRGRHPRGCCRARPSTGSRTR